jgi:hypothetical protein
MKKSNLRKFGVVLLAVILLVCVQNAAAQGQLVLSINRDFGYGGFDNKIEGLFSLTAEGPEDLVGVNFFIDEELLATTEAEPFRVQFSTNSYAAGEHRLYAIGATSSGEEIRSNEIVRVFLTKEESRGAIFGIIVPLVGVIILLTLASAVVPALLGRKEKVGEYGILGGTVCPKCGLPFSLKFWGLNLFTGKLQRCPHCGKWSVVKRANPEALAAAEARYRGEEPAQNTDESKEQRVRRQIDDSRYES